jgi:hypothetical protein
VIPFLKQIGMGGQNWDQKKKLTLDPSHIVAVGENPGTTGFSPK